MRDVETSDIVLAAYLKVKKYSLNAITKQGNRGIFCFASVDDAVLDAYDLGNGLVEPVAFNNAVKSLTTAVRRTI